MKPFFRTLPSVKRLQVTSMMGNLSIIGKKKKKKKNKKHNTVQLHNERCNCLFTVDMSSCELLFCSNTMLVAKASGL